MSQRRESYICEDTSGLGNVLDLYLEHRQQIYRCYFANCGLYEIEFGTVDRARALLHNDDDDADTGDVQRLMGLPILKTCAKIRTEVLELAIKELECQKTFDLSTAHSRDLPIATGLQRLPEQVRLGMDAPGEPGSGLRSLTIHVTNISNLKLWALASFAMLFIDSDYLARPERIQAQRDYLNAARKARNQPTAEAETAVLDEWEAMKHMAYGLDITYTHEPFSSVCDDMEIQELMRGVQGFGERCAREKITDTAEVRRELFMFMMSDDSLTTSRVGRGLVQSVFRTRYTSGWLLATKQHYYAYWDAERRDRR